MPDYQNELLLITCASGRQSTDLIPLVIDKWKHVRLQVNSEASKERLTKKYPDAEVVQADLADLTACQALLKGVACCWLVDPPFHPHESTLGYNMIDACLANRSAGGPLIHVVYSSVIFPVIRKMMNHDSKRYVEEYLIESGLQYTIVQPTHLMETMPLAKLMQDSEPVYPANWNPNTKFSYVTCKDVAAAVSRILAEREKHYYATYQLVGTAQPLSYVDVLGIVSKAIGKEVKIKQHTFEEATDQGLKAILAGKDISFATKDACTRMFLYYNNRGLVGNKNILQWILGREPMGYQQWVEVKVKEIQGQF